MSSSKILVTGATGFVGSRLVRLLLEQGNAVVASNVSGSRKNLEDVANRVAFHRADIGNFYNVLRMIEQHKPAAIYHIGAMRGPQCDADPQAGIQANAMGTYHILEAARLLGVKQVLYASSLSIFSAAHPTDKVLHDFTTTRPETVYAAAKLFSENLGLCYRRLHGIDFRGLRLATVLGPGAETHGYLEYFNKAIEESIKGKPYAVYVAPHSRVPIVHVNDAARAFVELAAAPADQIKTVNYNLLGQPETPSAQDLVDAVKAKIPEARLSFEVNQEFQKMLDSNIVKPFDDSRARSEWAGKANTTCPPPWTAFSRTGRLTRRATDRNSLEERNR